MKRKETNGNERKGKERKRKVKLQSKGNEKLAWHVGGGVSVCVSVWNCCNAISITLKQLN